MGNKNLSLEALKSHLFETLEGVKNLSDPEASENEKISIDQAKQIVDVSGAIIDIYKLQVEAIKSFTHKDNSGRPGEMMADMGIVEENNIKMLDLGSG